MIDATFDLGAPSGAQTSNRVTHTTAYRFTFELERPGGADVANSCRVDFVEWRQIGGFGE